MDKLLFRCVLFLSLCMLVVTVPIISSVKANGIIYIRADGTVEGTDNIQLDGNVYTFTGSINGPIVVERDDIVVDGSDYSLQGTGIGPASPCHWGRGDARGIPGRELHRSGG